MNRPKLPGTCLTAIVLAATIFVADPSAAATLHLTGPDGAVVILDGTVLEALPLREPLTVGMGEHRISSSLTGAQPVDQTLLVTSEHQIVHLQVRFVPLNRISAVTTSLMLAGSGQRYEGRPRLGAALTGLEALGLLTALMSELQVRNFRDDYLLAFESYQNAVSSADITRWRSAATTSHDDMNSAADRRDLGIAVAAGAVIVSALDAWFRFPALDAGVDLTTTGPFETALAPAGISPRAHVTLTLNF